MGGGTVVVWLALGNHHPHHRPHHHPRYGIAVHGAGCSCCEPLVTCLVLCHSLQKVMTVLALAPRQLPNPVLVSLAHRHTCLSRLRRHNVRCHRVCAGRRSQAPSSALS